MSNIFEGFPNRPDCKEFWQLSEIVLRRDARSNDGGDPIKEVVEEFIPVEVAVYMGSQRAALIITTSGPPTSFAAIVNILTATWIDGFVAGAEYAAKYPKDQS